MGMEGGKVLEVTDYINNSPPASSWLMVLSIPV